MMGEKEGGEEEKRKKVVPERPNDYTYHTY